MNQYKNVFLIGIGGIGISALARHFLATGLAVSGSDLLDSKILKELKSEGVRVKIGHKKANISKKIDLVVYNRAIPENNPELKESQRLGIKTIAYPEAVNEIADNYKTIAISGSNGKSTTTAIVSSILINAGYDPTVIVGTRMRELSPLSNKNYSNYRFGKSKWLVLEADEFGKAFHNYFPYAAIITNIDKEHLDIYKNLNGVKKSFLKFISNIQENGILILNSNDKNLKKLESEIKKITKKKNILIHWYDTNIHIKSLSNLGLLPSLIGEHNISNATGSFVLAKAIGISDQIIYNSIKKFSGTWRRMEYRGKCIISNNEFNIYDDYAHHPTEIKATLEAVSTLSKLKSSAVSSSEFKSESVQNPIICVFQPHQVKRVSSLFEEFVSAFKNVDILILLPIYRVPGRDSDVTASETRIMSKKLFTSIKIRNPNIKISYLANPKKLIKSLERLKLESHQSPILLMMGAGDIVKFTDNFFNLSK